MTNHFRPSTALAILSVIAVWSVTAIQAWSQATPDPAVSCGDIVLDQLSLPIYPPLARQAAISGDVKIKVLIRKDGRVESAEVLSGNPMLKQAALESAQKSTFKCSGCGEAAEPYPMTYTFGFYDDVGCGKTVRVPSSRRVYMWKCGEQWHWPESRLPEVTQSQGHVSILASSPCMQPES